MAIIRYASLAIASLAHAVSSASPGLPDCGSRNRAIGDGFYLTQYMHQGSSEFRLEFEVPEKRVWSRGGKLTTPIRIMFSNMDVSGASPSQIGFSNYEFRTSNGTELGMGTVRFECGGITVLQFSSRSHTLPASAHGPTTIYEPFRGQPISSCLVQLQETGRVKFSFSPAPNEPPFLLASARLPLRKALRKVRQSWQSELQKASRGLCRFAPPPPLPF